MLFLYSAVMVNVSDGIILLNAFVIAVVCQSEKKLVAVEWNTVSDKGEQQLGHRLRISHAKVSDKSLFMFLLILRSTCTGGMVRWAVVSPDGVALSRIVCVSASVNLPLHHKVQKFSSGTGSPRWSRKKGRKTVVVVVVLALKCRTATVSAII